jgi:hypothetical protein
MVTVIGILAAALGFGLAWWQSREVSRCRSAFSRAQKDLPHLVADTLRAIIKFGQREPGTPPEFTRSWAATVDCIDVNEDGLDELLVQYPSGAHGCALKVLAWRGDRFEELAQVNTGTPVGFEFGDFDADGKIEVKTEETDWSAGLPYATAPRVVLLFRWDGTRLAEVLRKPLSINGLNR